MRRGKANGWSGRGGGGGGFYAVMTSFGEIVFCLFGIAGVSFPRAFVLMGIVILNNAGES